MINLDDEVAIFREIEQILKQNKYSLLMKEVSSGCPCTNNKQWVFVNGPASRIGFLLEKLELLRCGT